MFDACRDMGHPDKSRIYKVFATNFSFWITFRRVVDPYASKNCLTVDTRAREGVERNLEGSSFSVGIFNFCAERTRE